MSLEKFDGMNLAKEQVSTLVKNAIEKAEVVKKALKDKGYKFYIDSPTNQIFKIHKKNIHVSRHFFDFCGKLVA